MGMFDTYISRELKCPVCGEVINEWQCKDGPCLLLTFKEGEELPLDEFFCEDEWGDWGMTQERPKDFIQIYTSDSNHHWIDAVGVLEGNKWVETKIEKVRELGDQENKVLFENIIKGG